jgi:hypothetical protein
LSITGFLPLDFLPGILWHADLLASPGVWS